MQKIVCKILPVLILMLGYTPASLAVSDTIYSVSNDAAENTIFAFARGEDGKFSFLHETGTGGKGTGDLEIPQLKKDPTHPLMNGDDPLISANALAMTADGKFLVVVNPGDASVSLMKIRPDGSLMAAGKAPASDRFPVSVAVSGDLVAVASVGENNGAGSVGLLRISADMGLEAVEGSRRDLGARPSTIDFSSNGAFVVVNELVTGKINVFAVSDGNLSDMPVSAIGSPRDASDRFHAIPVGFDIRPGEGGDIIAMSEARFLTPEFGLRGPVDQANKVVQSPLYTWQTGSLSTYHLSNMGEISLVSGDVLTGASIEGGELANCWVVFSPDGSMLWAVNALSSSISSFRIRDNATAALVSDVAFKIADETSFFSDIAINKSGTEIYQLVGNRGEIMIFDVGGDGNLKHKQTLEGMPQLGTYGLVVR